MVNFQHLPTDAFLISEIYNVYYQVYGYLTPDLHNKKILENAVFCSIHHIRCQVKGL